MQKDTYSVEETKYIKYGLYTITLLLFVISLFFILPNNRHKLDEKSYNVFARFNKTDGLLVGDHVRMAGINIGKVSNASLDEHFKAILTLDIKNGVEIPTDSSASIVSSSLIGGEKYIEIEVGGMDSYFANGDEFEYTQDAMILEELMQRIIDLGKASRSEKKDN